MDVMQLRPRQSFGQRMAAATGKTLLGRGTPAGLIHAWKWIRTILAGQPFGRRGVRCIGAHVPQWQR